MFKFDDKLTKFLIQEEGLELNVYLDSKGLPTIGIGHLIKKGEDFSNGLTEKEVYDLFEKDSQELNQKLDDLINVPLTDNQFIAIFSFVYNIGISAFKNSHVLTYINENNFKEAANWMLKWKWFTKKDGTKVDELLGRRKREVALWLS